MNIRMGGATGPVSSRPANPHARAKAGCLPAKPAGGARIKLWGSVRLDTKVAKAPGYGGKNSDATPCPLSVGLAIAPDVAVGTLAAPVIGIASIAVLGGVVHIPPQRPHPAPMQPVPRNAAPRPFQIAAVSNCDWSFRSSLSLDSGAGRP